MTPEETNLMLTLLANAIAQKLTDQQLAQAAALLTQLGTTLGFLASQRALESAGQGDGAASGDGVTTAGQASRLEPPCPAGRERPPCPGSGPCPQSPGEPAGSSATGR